MRQTKTFGRRAATDQQRRAPSSARLKTPQVEIQTSLAALPLPSNDEVPDVDRELEEWKAVRKLRRRSFREPWRTLAIVTSIVFGASFWLLPDSVADVVQYLTAGLTLASVFAGMRRPKPEPDAAPDRRVEPTA